MVFVEDILVAGIVGEIERDSLCVVDDHGPRSLIALLWAILVCSDSKEMQGVLGGHDVGVRCAMHGGSDPLSLQEHA